jgi:hypothetical protein
MHLILAIIFAIVMGFLYFLEDREIAAKEKQQVMKEKKRARPEGYRHMAL